MTEPEERRSTRYRIFFAVILTVMVRIAVEEEEREMEVACCTAFGWNSVA